MSPPAKSKAASATKTAYLVLGNQLFAQAHIKDQAIDCVFMREDIELCNYFRFHQQKIVFYLSAMRAHADALRDGGLSVHYETLAKSKDAYEVHFLRWLKKEKATRVVFFEIEDKFFEKRMQDLLDAEHIDYEVLPSPMFLCSRKSFAGYLSQSKRPFMKTFYQRQRKEFRILVGADGQPRGGQWNFDESNRLPLPKEVQPPALPDVRNSKQRQEVLAICQKHFADHPGDGANAWLPHDRAGALKWLQDFLQHRFAQFGPYEDALSDRSDFLFHSVLTPFLNVGLLTPDEVIDKALAAQKKYDVPLNSVEGFVRQIIGWREFIRGIYRNYSEQQDKRNFWQHTRKLNDTWYKGTTGVPPLDGVINKAQKFAYAHHIERLMVVGSLMLLLEVHPQEAHRWFMEMFVDSSDWVMGPNVYGMALHSDGGIFATKPYICGSNYYRKMGGFKKGEWCDAVDGLYWRFIDKHRKFFSQNPRLSLVVRSVDKLAEDRKARIFAAADKLQQRLTNA